MNAHATEAFGKVASLKVFEGASFTGKTERLIGEIADTLKRGIDPCDIAVFCATPVAAQELAARMADAGIAADAVKPMVAREFFLEMLAAPQAYAFTGRRPRLLLPFEHDFFLEDLKTVGIRPKRLKEMLKFFCKGFEDLETEDPDWLITNEERETMAVLNDSLDFIGAMLESEVAAFAVAFLRTDDADAFRRRFVFVDDFNLHSRATQAALSLLAGEALAVTANPDISYPVFESHPNAQGASELLSANPDAEKVRLEESFSCTAAGKAAEALYAELGKGYAHVDPAKGRLSLEVFDCADADAEMQTVVAQTRDALEANGKPPVVAVQNAAWRHRIVRALGEEGIEAEILPAAGFLRCDVRRAPGSGNARFVTLLTLAGDPDDATAWRSAVGFGDWLANSNALRSMRNRAVAEGRDLSQMLAEGDLEPDIMEGLDVFAGIDRVEKAYERTRAVLAELKGLEGEELIRAIAEKVSIELSDACGDAYRPSASLAALCLDDAPEADNSARAMSDRLRCRLAFARFESTGSVRVVSYENTAGLAPSALILAGFVNGFFPKGDYFDRTVLTPERAEKRRIEDLNCMAGVVARASERLAVTHCSAMPLEEAERLGVVIDRIVFEDGRRVAIPEIGALANMIAAEPVQ